MPELIEITNDGPLIAATNYWSTDLCRNGLVWCSINAGTIRVLIPPAVQGALGDMRTAKECVLSRGPWPAQYKSDAIELMWDDDSDSPFALHLSAASFDLLPEPDREWTCSVWLPGPRLAFEHICHWRRVPHIPWMKAWEGR